ncbi:hypothetical protein CcaverHIS002_0700880 [Cutaneotrichosporon cavernicola]|uniref:PTR2-domain-containing protein n=1 Tax=Cutaneotrichosporon cavernicola TaxID=279322 RepID=A0AA48QYH0_9TREE|nr:uncharacterized protein CcaverHIS019_0700890 [Cutaneotrichosporon cavernicola]BEI86742.1 hypothetical protein CcaverHIS002_0700880 [Cutaneotrichosporon cavernicola]BEI94517.1 hypothetical protein CcaverHIS019_0700890 [Cutaneotrichosporon cavernicola]BEJ02293.1 hypothetical protein CcaverHIS631_0700880 [Cutaneotrichosporon cavernicola]BEJ10052.1 hypothetical protein CcaverHIS641_0700870 [Cutaneotrichosporon cavernicola]
MAGLNHGDIVNPALALAQEDEIRMQQRSASIVSEKKQGASLAHVTSPHGTLDPSDPHYGDEFPTQDEIAHLHRVPDKIPWATYLVAYIELAERFSYYGCTVVFTNFIQHPLPPGSKTGAGKEQFQSGALNMGQRASTGLTTFNTFWVYVTPLFGAYLADKYWGRYKTVCVAVGVALIGHIILIISAIPNVIVNQGGALACFIIAIVIMGAGTGAFKSNISPLVAEQYRKTKMFVRTNKHGERVIVDPTLTTSRTYMYFYFFINVGALIGQIGMVYAEKYVGFWLSFLLPTIVFLTTPLVLWIGYNHYVKAPPEGSVLAGALHIFKFAAKGQWSLNPVTLFKRLGSNEFWDRAKPSQVEARGETPPSWMTFDDKWVDEVRRGFKACAVFLWYPIFWLTYNQINNNLTSQAATMELHGLPNDVLSNLNPFSLLILIPVCDLIIYPALRKRGLNFTPIKKITCGFFAGCAAMIWACVLQHYIYKTNPCGYNAATCVDAEGHPRVSPINVWAQTGSYVLIALAEVFASITGLEYAFTKAPKNMRSLVMSVFLFMSAFSSALGQAFVSLSSDPLLVWNYGSMACLAFAAGCGFWFTHRHLDAQEDELNALDAGAVDSNNRRMSQYE